MAWCLSGLGAFIPLDCWGSSHHSASTLSSPSSLPLSLLLLFFCPSSSAPLLFLLLLLLFGVKLRFIYFLKFIAKVRGLQIYVGRLGWSAPGWEGRITIAEGLGVIPGWHFQDPDTGKNVLEPSLKWCSTSNASFPPVHFLSDRRYLLGGSD